MKNFIKNMIAVLFLLTMFLITVISCSYAEKGEFSKLPIFMACEFLGCIIVFFIACHNAKAAKKAARKKKIALQRAKKQQAEKKAAEEKSKAYQNATFDFVTSYANDDISSNNSTSIENLEEVKIYLLAQNAISRYKRNTSR